MTSYKPQSHDDALSSPSYCLRLSRNSDEKSMNRPSDGHQYLPKRTNRSLARARCEISSWITRGLAVHVSSLDPLLSRSDNALETLNLQQDDLAVRLSIECRPWLSQAEACRVKPPEVPRCNRQGLPSVIVKSCERPQTPVKDTTHSPKDHPTKPQGPGRSISCEAQPPVPSIALDALNPQAKAEAARHLLHNCLALPKQPRQFRSLKHVLPLAQKRLRRWLIRPTLDSHHASHESPPPIRPPATKRELCHGIDRHIASGSFVRRMPTSPCRTGPRTLPVEQKLSPPDLVRVQILISPLQLGEGGKVFRR